MRDDILSIACLWDLTKDNLEEQSDELLDYLSAFIADMGLGDTALQAITNAVDKTQILLHPGIGATVTNIYDIDRSSIVNATDAVLAVNNVGALLKISV